MKQGFLRTPFMARFWWRQLQIEVDRNGAWVFAWNGLRWGFLVAGDREHPVMLEATRFERGAYISLVTRDRALAVVAHIDPA